MKRVLFVCMGNICRSPAAEGIMRKTLEDAGMDGAVEVDSAGTIGYHSGEPADIRMRRAAKTRGYEINSLARQIIVSDLENFDYVLVADADNLANVQMLDPNRVYQHKIHMITDFHPDDSVTEVPDPYYGGTRGFENVMDILEVSCRNILDHVKADIDE